jgi:adenylate kinase
MIIIVNLAIGLQKTNKIIEVVGVPGIGKDTILSIIREERRDLNAMSFSAIAELVCDGKTMQIAEKIKAGVLYVLEHQPIIIAAHTVYRTRPGTFEFEIGSEYVLKPAAYVHIVSTPSIVLSRHEKDNSTGAKERKFSCDEIGIMQDISLAVTGTLAKAIGAAYFEINNDNAHQAASEITMIAERYIL